ncbi:hypothetical protein Syun_005930 [Stephania yunnanensis]|uniref:Uncharacterized protein n=1 Tax=Stephania yunnanensis TaxID=152371 RepID=A0AAP0KXB6_9MAGN
MPIKLWRTDASCDLQSSQHLFSYQCSKLSRRLHPRLALKFLRVWKVWKAWKFLRG